MILSIGYHRVIRPTAVPLVPSHGVALVFNSKKDEGIKHGDVIVVSERSTFSSPTDPPITEFHDYPFFFTLTIPLT